MLSLALACYNRNNFGCGIHEVRDWRLVRKATTYLLPLATVDTHEAEPTVRRLADAMPIPLLVRKEIL